MKSLVCWLALVGGLAFHGAAETRTTNILDGVRTDAGGPFTLGDTGPFNFLLITNAGALTNTSGTVGRTLEAHSNLALVTGANRVWHHGVDFTLVATGGMNQVFVLDGARMNVGRQAFLGLDASSANNLLFVSGPGTFLDMPWFHLGQAGPGNQIIVDDGARVGRGISNDLINNIGDAEGSDNNLLLITGPGTSWHTDGFRVGHRGSNNRAAVRDGAHLTNGFLTVGREVSAMANVVEVTGAGSIWKVQNPSVYLGFNGSRNQIELSAGARLETPETTIGLSNTATLNVAALTGDTTVWANTGPLTVGDGGPLNSLTVDGGAALRSGSISIGNNSAGNIVSVERASVFNTEDLWIGRSSNAVRNVLSLAGTGTEWTNASRVILGRDGSDNQLMIAGGAVFRLGGLGRTGFMIGSSAASRANELLVTGPGSALLGTWVLAVGSSGSANRFVAADGARVQSVSAGIGQNCRARDNIAFLTGAGTVWSNGLLEVGFCSINNHLVISNGARVFADLVRTSVQGGASNAIAVIGPGSLLRAAGDLIVGNSGTANSLLIADGARVEGRADRIGWAGGGNTASLRGAGTTWSNVSLTIGENAPGNHLDIASGGQLDSGDGVIGRSMGSSSNSVLVVGQGSAWRNAGSLLVGSNGTRSDLVISQGGHVTDRAAYIGFSGELAGAGSICVTRQGGNKVVVTDPGSLWETLGPLYVGFGSIGNQLVVSNGGTVRATSLVVGQSDGIEPGGSCPLMRDANRLVLDGGSLSVTNSNADAVLEVRHGSLTLQSGLVSADRLIVTNGAGRSLLLSGGTLRIREGDYVYPGPGAGAFQVGDGMSSATLALDGGTLTAQTGFIVAPHAVLAGNGVVKCQLKNVQGTIAPGGRGPGRLALVGGLLSTGGEACSLSIDIGGKEAGVQYDQIVTDAAVIWARLDVRLHGGFVPMPRDTFEVIKCDFRDPESVLFNVSPDSRLLTTDRLGSFRVNLSYTNVVLMDYRSTDLDGDGIEDAWAARYFGHSPLTVAEKSADADGDGASNLDEFKAGTDPRNSASVFRVSIPYHSTPRTLEFECVPGREYRVWFSDDLITWGEVPNPTFVFYSLTDCTWTDDRHGTGGVDVRSRFYRVTVE